MYLLLYQAVALSLCVLVNTHSFLISLTKSFSSLMMRQFWHTHVWHKWWDNVLMVLRTTRSRWVSDRLFWAINNLDFTNKCTLITWRDNCCRQTKNTMMVFMYIYLVSLGLFDRIEHKFLVVGHSFSAADQDFALIEKHWKISKTEVVADVNMSQLQLNLQNLSAFQTWMISF